MVIILDFKQKIFTRDKYFYNIIECVNEELNIFSYFEILKEKKTGNIEKKVFDKGFYFDIK